MSKPTFIKITALLVAAASILAVIARSARPDPVALPSDSKALFRTAVRIPGGIYQTGSREPGCYPAQSVELAAFYIWPVEVPRAWWERFQPPPEASPAPESAPLTRVSYEDALLFCRWFSGRYQVTARLPTREEWEAAARAGTSGVSYPWGWGLPAGRAVFDADTYSAVATHEPNPWGLYDMAGNLAEWCLTDDDASHAPVMGGSWAERDPRFLRISHRLLLPKGYRDADVGFRIVIEP